MSEREQMSHIFASYNRALVIDQFFDSTGHGGFSKDEFYDLVKTIESTGSSKNQERTTKLFMTLPKLEVIRRATIVAKFSQLLERIAVRRNDISSTPQT